MLNVLIPTKKKERKEKKRDTRKPLEVMDIFIKLIMVMISLMYAYVQTHQIVYIKYTQFFVYRLYLKATKIF